MTRRDGLALLLAVAPALAGCAGVQSALDPAGPGAVAVNRLTFVMTVGAALIFFLVCGLTAWAILAPQRWRGWMGGRGAVIGGGVVLPLVVLTALLIYGLGLSAALVARPKSPPLRIEVSGERWWWRVSYPAEGDAPAFVTANEIRIPTGRPVAFALTTPDVIHSFWIPNLAGKLDMIPGRTNSFVMEAARAGRYRGQCAEFCGGQHALMAFDVVALAPEAFVAWRKGQAQSSTPPADDDAQLGQSAFLANGCGACHAVRGTPAAGRMGPDLTHVGSRTSLAAGTLDNDPAAFALWIVNSQGIKPGNRMPSFPTLEPTELDSVAAYLESLK